MDDLDVLARDFGFGPRGKSNPMRSAQSDRQPMDDPLFSDMFGEPAKFTASSDSNYNKRHSSMRDFDYDSIFNSSAASEAKKTNNSSNKSESGPVYDKPVYDEDLFDGLPGLKSKSRSSTVRYDNDVFASASSPPSSKSRNQNNEFDDLLGNLGQTEKAGGNIRSGSTKSNSSSKGFDDLLAGFGSGTSAASNRTVKESTWGSVPVGGSKHGSVLDNPSVVSESASTQGFSSSRVFADPLDEISKHSTSRSARTEASTVGGRSFDDLDPLNSFGRPVNPFSTGRDKRGKEGSSSGSASPQSATTREPKGNSSFRYSESNMEKRTPVDNFQEPPLFDVPNVSTDFQKSFDQTASSPQYYETSSHVDMSPTSSGLEQQSDDVWLTVSEIPLLTQPTAAPPPSRPPPAIPRQTSRAETGSFSSSSRKKGDGFSSPSNHSQHFQSPKLAQPAGKGSQVSQFDELEDFALGRSQTSADESANLHSREETNAFSAAAASAAAMKEAMEKAEAKFRHAKEVRERENAKAAKYKESVQLERDEHDGQEQEFQETEEIFEHNRNQKEEGEREQRRLQREGRSREIEREKARQAVERANREARERAAVQARDRAAAEARLKAERAFVDKASAEARERAGRVAVQRAQAEARERAAAEAKERAEKAALEARERAAAAETREKELRDKASLARAEEAKRRAERAAVERAGAEARERAATEARERAAAASAAKMNQQRNNDDLESFFGMGRASSAPRGRTNSTDPFNDQQFQNKGGSEAGRGTTSSSGSSSNMKKASSTTNIVDDLSSIFGGAPSAGDFQEVEGETEERRKARLDRHQRTQERAAKAVAEKNQRDLQVQMEQEERHRIAETLDFEIKRWAAGKEGNLRALLSTLQYVLWPECGWQPVSLTDLITAASVKKVYRKATLCIHPDKVQQKGATLQQKYIAEKVFDLLKEAWNKLNSEELF